MTLGQEYSEKYEVNPVSKGYHDIDQEYISFNELVDLIKSKEHKITSTRIRFVTDYGFPYYCMSYFHVSIDGVRHSVLGSPFEQVPKRQFRQQLYKILKQVDVYIPCFFDSISTLD